MAHAGEKKSPKRCSGQAFIPLGDRDAENRAVNAARDFKSIWVSHPPQETIIQELQRYIRECEGYGDKPLNGCRLGENSQSGKSSTMARLKAVRAEARASAGLEPNEFQVVIIELDSQTTLKAVYQEVLQALGDEHWNDNVSAKVLEKRIAKWVRELEVEVLIIDEVQHLDRRTTDVTP